MNALCAHFLFSFVLEPPRYSHQHQQQRTTDICTVTECKQIYIYCNTLSLAHTLPPNRIHGSRTGVFLVIIRLPSIVFINWGKWTLGGARPRHLCPILIGEDPYSSGSVHWQRSGPTVEPSLVHHHERSTSQWACSVATLRLTRKSSVYQPGSTADDVRTVIQIDICVTAAIGARFVRVIRR